MRSGRRTTIVLAVILVACIPGTSLPAAGMDAENPDAYSTVLRADAAYSVISEVLDGSFNGKWVYSYRYPVPPGTVLETWYGSVSLPSEEGWVIFIDDMPMENWAHTCRYVFVNTDGILFVYEAHGPPEVFTDWDRLGFCHNGFISDMGENEFRCLVFDDRILYWKMRDLGDTIVEDDYVLYEFNRSTGSLISMNEHSRSNVPEPITTLISQEEAESLVPGAIHSSNLRILSSESSAFPVQPIPTDPCWVVQSVVGNTTEITVVDAITGKNLGNYTSDTITGDTPGQTPPTASTPKTEATLPSPAEGQEVPGFCGMVAIGGLMAWIWFSLQKNEE